MEKQQKKILWENPGTEIELLPGEVHVWRAQVHASLGAVLPYLDLLNEEEVARAKRFLFAKDRQEFAFSRGLLRRLLGRYLGSAPETLVFRQNAYGKPFVEDGVGFNISHSRGVALLIFSLQGDLGIDVEKIRTKTKGEAITQRNFSPVEIAFLNDHPPEQRHEVFFKLWTLKEAFIKAKGKGMAYPLNEFGVQWDEAKRVTLSFPTHDEDPSRWCLRLFEPFPGHQGAFAISLPHVRPKFLDWNEAL